MTAPVRKRVELEGGLEALEWAGSLLVRDVRGWSWWRLSLVIEQHDKNTPHWWSCWYMSGLVRRRAVRLAWVRLVFDQLIGDGMLPGGWR